MKRKKYIPPIVDVTDYAPLEYVLGGNVSIFVEEDETDSWDVDNYIGSWEKIWSEDTE